jgi:anti-sigma B factor antagonist
MSPFEVKMTDAGDRVVVTLSGECDLSVREQLTKALLAAAGRSRVVEVDLDGVTFMDSSGIHGLVMGYHAVQERDGELYVVNAGGVVKDVLVLTGVADLLRPPGTASGATAVADGGSGDEGEHV